MIGADRVEGDVAEVEQAGEADHDVEAPAEHHVGEDQDAERSIHLIEPPGRRQRATSRGIAEARPSASSRNHTPPPSTGDGGARPSGAGARPPRRAPAKPAGEDDRDEQRRPAPARLRDQLVRMFWSVLKPMIGTEQPSVTAPWRGDPCRAPRIESGRRRLRGGGVGGMLGLMAQTFSTSGRPSRPDGRKISTMARIEKAATSL